MPTALGMQDSLQAPCLAGGAMKEKHQIFLVEGYTVGFQIHGQT
jgi:hypothetical protein